MPEAMSLPSRALALLCLLPLLTPEARAEEKLGKGFADIVHAAAGTFVASADGTVRRLDGETLPVAVQTGRMMTGLAVSEDGQQVAAVGAGVVARSSDGGRTFRVEPTPDGATVYAAAFARGDLLLFDVQGRGFRAKEGQGFQPMSLPRAANYWTASFSGQRGYVVGQEGAFIATQDGGKTWKALRSPDPEPQGVLASGQSVWVSGREGVFRSTDEGRTFRKVYSIPTDKPTSGCARMGSRGSAVVVACTPYEHGLAYAADGTRFEEVPVRDVANLLSASIAPDGELWAVGSWELLVRATPRKGRLLSHSEQTRTWLGLMEKRRAQEDAAKRAAAQPKPPPAEKKPSLPDYPVREGEPRVVTGTVRDERGLPRAGVPLDIVASWAVHGEGYQRATTDNEGRYRFKPSKVDGVRLSVRVPGFAPESRVLPVSPTGETVVDIALRPEVAFAGTVVSAEGPVRRGFVRLWPLPPEGADLEKWRFRTANVASGDLGADGTFRIQGVPAGEYLLETHADGFLPLSQRVRAPDAALRVRVSRGASVVGRLLSAQGAPMAGALAHPAPVPETRRELAQAGMDILKSSGTDAQGRFQFDGIPDGAYTLEVSTGRGIEHVCLRRNVVVRGGEGARVELQLGQGPTISGRVIDARGRPVEDIEVMGYAPGDGLCSTRISATDRNGAFTLRDVEPSTPYSLTPLSQEPPRDDSRDSLRVKASPGDRDVLLQLPEAP